MTFNFFLTKNKKINLRVRNYGVPIEDSARELVKGNSGFYSSQQQIWTYLDACSVGPLHAVVELGFNLRRGAN